MENKLDKLLKKTNKGINDAIKTLDRFQKKDITLVKTSFPFLDDVCLGGLMPNLILAILGRPSHGKCLGKGTKVLMYDGTLKKVEDVVKGDKLMGDDTTPRNVLSIARGREEMYWVRQNKGIDYRVNKSHILSLKKSRQEGHMNKGDIINISVDEYLNKSNKFKSNYKGYKVAVEFTEKKLSIDPYFLGLWLGDGAKKNIRCIYTNDSEIENYIMSFGGYKSNSQKFGMLLPKGMYVNEFKYLYNIKKTTDLVEKYIPDDYNINSRNNRLKLLAGLLDSDGYYSRKDNTFEICQKNK